MAKTLIFLLSILLVACTPQQYVVVQDQRIAAEIADTQEERAQGLMHRKELCDNCGMLFIFDNEEKTPFWMKNTLIPLDIIYINQEGIITDILSAEPCTKEPCTIYMPQQPARYVLEVNKGFAEQHSLERGMKVTLPI